MRIDDLFAGAHIDAPELFGADSPLSNPSLLVGAQLTRLEVDVLAGTVGVLFELRQVPALAGNTALLRVWGAAQQDWIRTSAVDRFTAWSLTGMAAERSDSGFHLVARFSPAGTLRILGESADLALLDAEPSPHAPAVPSDLTELLRFGIADGASTCRPIAVARSHISHGV